MQEIVPTITALHAAPAALASWPPPWMTDLRRDPLPADGGQEAPAMMPDRPEPPPIVADIVDIPAGVRLLNSLSRHPGRWIDHSGAWESFDNRIDWDTLPPPPPFEGTAA